MSKEGSTPEQRSAYRAGLTAALTEVFQVLRHLTDLTACLFRDTRYLAMVVKQWMPWLLLLPLWKVSHTLHEYSLFF
jgi:hypothetical protein